MLENAWECLSVFRSAWECMYGNNGDCIDKILWMYGECMWMYGECMEYVECTGMLLLFGTIFGLRNPTFIGA